MASKTTYTCDRCGSHHDSMRHMDLVRGLNLLTFFVYLCDGCMKELRSWVKTIPTKEPITDNPTVGSQIYLQSQRGASSHRGSNYMTDTEIVLAEQPRSELVRLQIVQLGKSIHSNFISLGRLLKEARDNKYHNEWGFTRFGDWVESASGLDVSERTAYDFIKVVETAERLQLTDEQLQEYKISNLKEILSLTESSDPEVIKELLEESKTMQVKKVKELVGAIKQEEYVYHTLKFARDVEDNVYQPAVERCRRVYGNTMGQDGELEDISDSRAVEMIMADWNASPEEEEYPVIEAEWEDVIESSAEEEEPDTPRA